MKGLELSQKYYIEYGLPMIKEKFPDYEEHIAVGLVGPGSECYGFDDTISRDHDFGPSFCIWLTDEDFEKIGAELIHAYKGLPETFMGYKRIVSAHGDGRVGVFRISDFYRKYTGKADASLTLEEWFFIPEHFLAEVTNGKVFRDDLGEFSKVRSLFLNYYPEDVRIKKIAARAATIAQSGQYNYSRCMRRPETVAARMSLDEFIRNTLSMVYLLNKKYQPFYKWAFRGMETFDVLAHTRKMIEDLVLLPIQKEAWHKENDDIWGHMLNMDDKVVELIESICDLIVKELLKQKLTDHTDPFLQNHTISIMSRIKNDKIRAMHGMAG